MGYENKRNSCGPSNTTDIGLQVQRGYREGISKVQILDYRGVQRGYREGISKVQILDYRRGTRKVQRRYKYRHWRGQVK